MARYFAEIQNNIVQRVIVADSEQWCVDNLGGEWKETFMDNPDKNYTGKGFIYNTEKDNFHSPKPYDSFTLDEKLQWKAPKDMPVTNCNYFFCLSASKMNVPSVRYKNKYRMTILSARNRYGTVPHHLLERYCTVKNEDMSGYRSVHFSE